MVARNCPTAAGVDFAPGIDAGRDPQRRPSASEILTAFVAIRRAHANRFTRGRWRQLTAAAICVLAVITVLEWRSVSSWRQPTFQQATTLPSQHRVIAAAVSPDARTLAYSTVDASLLLRRLADGALRPLRLPLELRIDKIAWFREKHQLLVSGSEIVTGSPGIWTVGIDPVSVTQVAASAFNAVPSPDGTQIAFTRNKASEIWLMNVANQESRLLLAGSAEKTFPVIFWPATSRHLGFLKLDTTTGWNNRANAPLAHNRSYETVDIKSGKTSVWLRDIQMTSVAVLPDRVLFSSPGRSDADPQDNLFEFKIDSQTGAARSAPSKIAHISGASLSHLSASLDGKHVMSLQTASHPGVYVADIGSPSKLANIRAVTADENFNFPHAWTVDGRSIIFESDRNGHLDLFAQNIDDQVTESIVADSFDKSMAQVSSDGRWLLYVASDKNVPAWKRLMRVPVNGGKPVEVLSGRNWVGEFRCPLFGGKQCVMRNEENKKFVFYELDPIRGQGKELARSTWSWPITGDWALSPDGSLAAIPDHDEHNPRIRVVALDHLNELPQQREIRLENLGFLNGLNWTTDGTGWFAVVLTGARSEWSQNRSRLINIGMDGRAEIIRDFEGTTFALPSPDGRHLAFVDYSLFSNVWKWDRPSVRSNLHFK